MPRFHISKSLTKGFSFPRQKRNASENTIALRMLFAFRLLLAINLWSLSFWRSLARLFRISAFFCLSHLQQWNNCYHKLPKIWKKFLTEKKGLHLFKNFYYKQKRTLVLINKTIISLHTFKFFFQTLLSLQKKIYKNWKQLLKTGLFWLAWRLVGFFKIKVVVSIVSFCAKVEKL